MLGLQQRAPRPDICTLVVAGSKRVPPDLVEDVRELDVGIDVAADRFDAALEEPQAFAQALEAALALAGVPVQAGQLALHTPLAHGILAGAGQLQDGSELHVRLVATTDGAEQIAHVLADAGNGPAIGAPTLRRMARARA